MRTYKSKSIFVFLLSIVSFYLYISSSGYNFPYIWKSKVKEAEIIFIGSQHIMTNSHANRIYPLKEILLQHINKSNYIIFESSNKNTNQCSKMMLLENNDSLKDYLSKLEIGLIKKKLTGGLNVSIDESIWKMKPIFLNQFLHYLILDVNGAKPENGIDAYFESKIRDKSKILYFDNCYESLRDQMSMDIDLQLLVLRSLLKKSEKRMITEHIKSSELYYQGKISRILYEDYCEDENDVILLASIKKSLKITNQRWVNKLESIVLKEKKYFVIVGALHFFGEGNIISLLKDRGYFIQKITD